MSRLPSASVEKPASRPASADANVSNAPTIPTHDGAVAPSSAGGPAGSALQAALQTLKQSATGVPALAPAQPRAGSTASAAAATGPKPPAQPVHSAEAPVSATSTTSTQPEAGNKNRDDGDARGRQRSSIATPDATPSVASTGATFSTDNADVAGGQDAPAAASSSQGGSGTAPLAAQSGMPDPAATTGGSVDQVAGGLAMSLRNGQTEATIALRPQALGEVKIQITSSQNGLVIRMAAERDSVGELLRSRLGELRELLAGRQVAVAELHVLHNPPSVAGRDTPSEQQSGWQERDPRPEQDATQDEGGYRRSDDEQQADE